MIDYSKQLFEARSKEEAFSVLQKMDAVSLQGIWLNFPKVTGSSAGRLHVAAGIYHALLEAERRRRTKPQEPKLTPKQIVQMLFEKTTKRLFNQENEDLVLILA